MSIILMRIRILFAFLAFAYSRMLCSSAQSTRQVSSWLPARASWYGGPDADGSDGGACGYGSLVDVTPLRTRVGAVGPLLFNNGLGCGACYKVRCLDRSICSRRAVTVIVTDSCPGGDCLNGFFFDLGGSTFGRMAIAGYDSRLRDRGQVPVVFRRTTCRYGGRGVAFHVAEGSTPFWLSLLVEFEEGDGEIAALQIQDNSGSWMEMSHLWGATWCLYKGPVYGPFSMMITTPSGQNLTARHVIPQNWVPANTYSSALNFAS